MSGVNISLDLVIVLCFFTGVFGMFLGYIANSDRDRV